MPHAGRPRFRDVRAAPQSARNNARGFAAPVPRAFDGPEGHLSGRAECKAFPAT